jgi:hypothetical protein
VQHEPELSSARYLADRVVKKRVHPHTTSMRMIRTWAVYHVHLGYPILVQRYPSKWAADKAAAEMRQSCDALHVVEQLMPDGFRVVSACRGGRNDDAGDP